MLRRFGGMACVIAVCAAQWAVAAEDPPRVLNNLVTELLAVEAISADEAKTLTLTAPRAGWIYVGLGGGAGAELTLDGAAVSLPNRWADMNEGMFFVSAGEHKLGVKPPAGAKPVAIVVRSIPELLFSRADASPQIAESGKFDPPWLRQYVLPHLNTVLVGGEADDDFLKALKASGIRILQEIYAKPYLDETEKWDLAKSFDYWAASPGMTHPLLSGLVGDEFFRSDEKNSQRYRMVLESIEMIHKDPRFKDRVFYPYITTLYGGDVSEQFLKAVMGLGYKFPWERYLFEKTTIEEARKYLNERLVEEALKYEKAVPGIIQHIAVCFGHMLSAPNESVNSHPTVDHKYYMDMQFNIIANDPAFKGLWGVMEYLSSYADEEYTRWAMRLYRHYCIEGRKEMLSDKYGYVFAPDHLTNPDFDKKLEGWTVQPAEPGSITTGTFKEYSWLQGRYPKTEQGDTFLLAKRSAKAANVFSQEIRNLKAGERYCVKMFTGDHGDLVGEKSNMQKHDALLEVKGADRISARSFQSVFANCYSHKVGKFDDVHKYWMNYHVLVFRAKGPTARLVVSDWAKEKPTGPIGQELMFNFFEVQPYYLE